MGTFHSDKGPLHGKTVVVKTKSHAVFIGRCDTQTPAGIYLLDADRHEDGHDGKSNDEYIKNAAQWGHWPKIPQITVPNEDIESVVQLSEISA